MYGAGKNPIMMTEAQKTLPMNLQKEILAKEAKESNSPMDMYGKKGSMAPKKKPMKEKSRAEQKAIYASGYKG